MANSLNAVTVGTYVDSNGQVQKSYQNIGRAFETKTGWIVRLNALPLTSMNDKGVLETIILLTPPKDNSERPAQNRGGPYGKGGFHGADDSSEIPFSPEWR